MEDPSVTDARDPIGVVGRYAALRIRPVSRSFARALLRHARGSLEEALDLVDVLAGAVAVRRYSRERAVSRMLRQIERDGDPRRRLVPSRAPLRLVFGHRDGIVAVEVP